MGGPWSVLTNTPRLLRFSDLVSFGLFWDLLAANLQAPLTQGRETQIRPVRRDQIAAEDHLFRDRTGKDITGRVRDIPPVGEEPR